MGDEPHDTGATGAATSRPATAADPGVVRLSFRARPAHVRTARLVAVTVARRAGWPESMLESVRQGVGEACALALRAAGPDGVLTVELDDRGDELLAWVSPVPDANGAASEELPWAVLHGLTDGAAIEQRGADPALRLTWADGR